MCVARFNATHQLTLSINGEMIGNAKHPPANGCAATRIDVLRRLSLLWWQRIKAEIITASVSVPFLLSNHVVQLII